MSILQQLAQWKDEEDNEQALLVMRAKGHYVIGRPYPQSGGTWRVVAGPFPNFELANQMITPLYRGVESGFILKVVTLAGTYDKDGV